MLRPEAKQDRATLSGLDLDHGSLARHRAFTFEPSAEQHAALRVTADHARGRSIGCGACLHLEGAIERAEPGGLGRHAVGQRIGLEFEFDHRAGAEVLVGRQASRDVFHRCAQHVDGQLARRIEGHQRAATGDELPEHGDALRAEAADVLRRHGPRRVSGDQAIGALVGNHNRIEARPQAAATNIGISDVLERKLVLFQQPARPPFVGVLDPGLVERDPRAAEGARILGRPRGRRGDAQPQVARDALDRVAHALGLAHHQRTRLIRVSLDRHRRRQPRDLRAGLEQPVDGDAGAVAAAIDDVERRFARFPPHPSRGNRGLVEARRRWRLEVLIDAIDLDVHLQRQRPARDIVRPINRRPGRTATHGVLLDLQQRLGVRAKRLCHEDDVSALRVHRVGDAEWFHRAPHFHGAVDQELFELARRMRIKLPGRHEVRERPALESELHLPLAHAIKVSHQLSPVACRRAEHAARRREVVVHDVAQVPLAAGPGVGKPRRR